VASTTVFVLKGYPRLSETFIAQEIRALEAAGMDIAIVALRRPTDNDVHPVHREIRAPVHYIPEYLHHEPLRVIRSWWKARRLPGYAVARRTWLAGLWHDRTRNRIRRFGQALVLAAELPAGARHLHAHFIHTPAAVTLYASLMTGLPWTVSAHAKDIWTTPEWDLREKLAHADWAVTCTRFGHRHLCGLAARPDTVELVYHGLDLGRFAPPANDGSSRNGSDPADPVRILTVGRAVEKKGLDVLLEALALLPRELAWQWHHIGDGELAGALRQQADRLGIVERTVWHGAQPQDFVLEQYRTADLFVLPCRISRDGDRDGLPNVLMEAQSQRLACISTPISGVPELIVDGETGLLVEPESPDRLAEAVATLITRPALRHRLGRAGEQRVRGAFDHHRGIARLLELFGHAAETRSRGAA